MVVGSSPTVGVLFLMHVFLDMHDVIAKTERIMPARKEATARGFEPLRAEPNGFLVHHLSHSVTLSCCKAKLKVSKGLSLGQALSSFQTNFIPDLPHSPKYSFQV